MGHVPGSQARRRRPGADAVAVAVLVLLPVLVFGGPALLGHPVLPGDDLTQNFPLRVLAGQLLRGGHLPLYDPYIWGGAPLLAGWNAGAAYPLTALFAVAPGTAAWAAGQAVTWAAAGLGLFCLLRALRLGALAALLGGLSFAFAGAMAAQVAHFGLVAGMSWVPFGLLSVLRLTQPRAVASRLRWVAVLATVTGLIILAGEPRAIDDGLIIVAGYALWRVTRCGRGWFRAAGSVAGGVGLGLVLGAVQWLPGLAAVSTSQRGAATMALFDSGSLPHKWLLLALVPDLLGGSGSFGQPAFAASYNLAEVTSYVGLLPLVAAVALLGRLRLEPGPRRWRWWPARVWTRLPEWFVWHLMAVAGVLLALGGNTPLGRILVHLPLFGDQRLQSRNILITDLALAVLLAYWADGLLRDRSFDPRPAQVARRAARWAALDRETWLGLLPPAAVSAVVLLGLTWGAGFFRWLGLGPATAAVAGRLQPWLVPYLVIAVLAAAFVVFGRRLPPRRRGRLLGGFVLADLVVFTVLGVVAVAPGLGQARDNGTRAAAGAGGRPAAGEAAGRPAAGAGGRSAEGAGGRSAAARPVAALGYPGRFAIYDPGVLYPDELPVLGSTDLNVISGTPSVQGYSSIVDRAYAAATGSHRATGDGQDVLSPAAIGTGVLDQLDTSVLLTPAAYLTTPAGRPDAAAGAAAAGTAAGAAGTAAGGTGVAAGGAGPAGTGRRQVIAGRMATWYLGAPVAVTAVRVAVDEPSGEARSADQPAGRTAAGRTAAAGRIRLGLVTTSGTTRWLASVAGTNRLVSARSGHPVTAVAVVAAVPRGHPPVVLGAPTVTEATGRAVTTDGQLQDALTPPRWRYAGHDGSFAVFADRFARAPLRLAALPGRPATGASVTRIAGPVFGPTAAAVRSAHGVRVIRAVAAIPGWSASWQPRHGPAVPLPVRADGLVQAVDVPPGAGVLTWRYMSPGVPAGGWLSVAASLAVASLVAVGLAGPVSGPTLVSRRSPRRAEPRVPSRRPGRPGPVARSR
jgi:hypothetical protein